MIFLCFSVKDRIPLINDFYQFLSNFGLDIWYDRRNIFLGDNRFDTNITKGVKNPNIKYAIIFYSENFEKGNICIQEYKILEEKINKMLTSLSNDIANIMSNKFKKKKIIG